jgi:ankyrin repeat protein
MSIVVSSVRSFYFMRPGRSQEIDPPIRVILRYVCVLMIFVGTSVYVITLNTCLNKAFVLFVLIPITPLIMVKPKTTSRSNSKKEKDTFYVFGFMSMFLPIGAWANIELIPLCSSTKLKRPNYWMMPKISKLNFLLNYFFWLDPYILLLDVVSISETLLKSTQNNGLSILQCFKNSTNSTWLGYRTHINKNTSIFDIGIQICSNDICLPAIRVCAENEEPLDMLKHYFFPAEQILFLLGLIILLIQLVTKNKFRLYALRKKLCCSTTISFDLFQYCARNMNTSPQKDEMLLIFNQAAAKNKNFINQKDQLYGETCAFCAVDAEDYDLLERILDLGGNIFLYNYNGENVFSLLKKKFEEEDDEEMKAKIKGVLAKRTTRNSKLSCGSKSLPKIIAKNFEAWKEQPMHKYVRKNFFGKMICSVLIGGNLNTKDHTGKTVFEYLLEKLAQDEDVIKQLKGFKKWWILNATDGLGESLIHKAVKLNHQVLLTILIDNKVNVNSRDSDKKWTPLHYAANFGTFESAKLLINNGASVNAKDSFGQTPLFLAIKQHQRECINLLIENRGDVKAKDKNNQTLLHILGLSSSYSEKERNEMLSLLINCKADVNAIDKHGSSPLHNLALKAQPICLKLLMEKGADVKAANKKGETPLHLVSRAILGSTEEREQCIRYLIEAGADVNAYDKAGVCIIHNLVFKTQASCLQLLIENGADVTAKSKWGETPLHLIGRTTCCSKEDMTKCIEYLIEAGADVNAKDMLGCSPIYNSIFFGQPGCLKILIEKGADVNAKMAFGVTYLHLFGWMSGGSKEEREKCIEYLIEAGADVNARCLLCFLTPQTNKIVRNYIKNHPQQQAANAQNYDSASINIGWQDAYKDANGLNIWNEYPWG